jgi:hypothetical protein
MARFSLEVAQMVLVRLQPCGQVKARFIAPDGKTVINVFPYYEILGTPGPPERTRDKKLEPLLAADAP